MKRIKAFIAYLFSTKGKAQIHALITTGLTIYVTLRSAGV